MLNKKQTIFIAGPAGQQELLISFPEVTQKITCVICHPHPVHGGTMHNKVVYTLASAMNELDIKAVRFNFRGVQKSEGQFDHGRGELEDLINVVQWVKNHYPDDIIWLAGFSFGAFIAIKGRPLCDAQQLVIVAPPAGQPYFEALPALTCPWVLVQGGQDEVIASDQVMNWAKHQFSSPEMIFMPEAGHFFHGQLVEMKEELLSRLKKSVSFLKSIV